MGKEIKNCLVCLPNKFLRCLRLTLRHEQSNFSYFHITSINLYSAVNVWFGRSQIILARAGNRNYCYSA